MVRGARHGAGRSRIIHAGLVGAEIAPTDPSLAAPASVTGGTTIGPSTIAPSTIAPSAIAPSTIAASTIAQATAMASTTAGSAGHAAEAAVLRGRRAGTSVERAPAIHDPAAPAVAGFQSAGGGLSPEAAAELRELQRIAEERGYNAGRSRATAELEAAIEAAGIVAARLEALAPRETTVVAHAIAELALAIARRVVESELHSDPTVLIRALEGALSSINGSPEARVLLNPATVEPVRAAWEATHGLAYLGKHWTFEADPSLPMGGCILRYEHGFVDAGLEAQIEEIGIALDGAIPAFWRDDAQAGAA